jgi:hypothetical protein
MFTRNAVGLGATALVLVISVAGPASADAQGNASCIGFEASGISPVGSSQEFPGGVPELQAILRDAFGHPTGAIISQVARQHLGSHEACDEGE